MTTAATVTRPAAVESPPAPPDPPSQGRTDLATPVPYAPPPYTPPPAVPLPPPSPPHALAAALARARFTAPAIALLGWGTCPRCVLRLAGVREAALYEAAAPAPGALLAALRGDGDGACGGGADGVDGGQAMQAGVDENGDCPGNDGGGRRAGGGAEAGVATTADGGDGGGGAPTTTAPTAPAPPPTTTPTNPVCCICVGVLQALDAPTPPLPPPMMAVAAALDSGAGEWRCAASAHAAALAAAFKAEGHDGTGAATLQILYPASAAVRQACAVAALAQAGLWEEDGEDEDGGGGGHLHCRRARAVVDVKDALRLALLRPLGAALGRRLGGEGEDGVDVALALQFLHPDSAGEAEALAAAGAVAGAGKRGRGPRWKGPVTQGGSGAGGKKRPRGGGGEGHKPPAVGRVATGPFLAALAAVPAATLTAAGLAVPPRPPPPGTTAHLVTRVRRAPLLIGGYYLKTERDVSQSPFFVGGARLGRTSVQEVIESFLLPALRADGCKFVTAGREDMDVRMLGKGRPFVMEVANARARVDWLEKGGGASKADDNPNPAPPSSCPFAAPAATVPPDLLAGVEDAVNASRTGVGVRRLTLVTRAALAAIKAGESAKEKSYLASVTLPVPATPAMLARLNGVKGLALAQTTPARVEARRAMLVRHRTVHELSARLEAESEAGGESGGGEGAAGALTTPTPTDSTDPDPRRLAVTLRTQAGLYVKEFVHGDSGRTVPDLASVAGCPPEAGPAAITALDVLAVHLDFV
jgi:tRNA pseudouridine synthase 10